MSDPGTSVTDLFEEAERIACDQHGGHLTLLRFTTHWKAMFDTPNLDTGEGRAEVSDLPDYPDLRSALVGLLEHHHDATSYHKDSSPYWEWWNRQTAEYEHAAYETMEEILQDLRRTRPPRDLERILESLAGELFIRVQALELEVAELKAVAE